MSFSFQEKVPAGRMRLERRFRGEVLKVSQAGCGQERRGLGPDSKTSKFYSNPQLKTILYLFIQKPVSTKFIKHSI
jgi:hypothetical protein